MADDDKQTETPPAPAAKPAPTAKPTQAKAAAPAAKPAPAVPSPSSERQFSGAELARAARRKK